MLARSLSNKCASDSVQACLSCQGSRQSDTYSRAWTGPHTRSSILPAANRSIGPADTAAPMEKTKSAPEPGVHPWELPPRASSDDVKVNHDQLPTPADLYEAARAQAKGVFTNFASTTRQSLGELMPRVSSRKACPRTASCADFAAVACERARPSPLCT